MTSVEIEVGHQVPAEDLEPPVDPLPAVARAAQQHLSPVVEKCREGIPEAHDSRRVVGVEDVEVKPDPNLQVGLPEQLLHQQLRVHGTALRLEHDADIGGRFVAHVGEKRQLARVQQLRHLLDHPRLLHLMGNLRDHDLIESARPRLDRPAGAQPEAAAPGPVRLDNGVAGLDEDAAGGKVGPRHQVDELVDGRLFRKLEQVEQRVAQLARVVRRDAGRHPDRDPRGAVGEQVGEAGRQDHRFPVLAVIGLAEVDGVLVDPVEQRPGDHRQPRLGVTHGGGVVAVDVAEVAVAVDERIALGETPGRGAPGRRRRRRPHADGTCR